jgi:hypothetical protein
MLHGGRWERWWVDSGVNAYVWMHEPRYLKDQPRPGGCAIWEDDPKPLEVENYSANSVISVVFLEPTGFQRLWQ